MQHAIANFASYTPAENNENPHARVMLADRRNGNPIFYGKNVVSECLMKGKKFDHVPVVSQMINPVLDEWLV